MSEIKKDQGMPVKKHRPSNPDFVQGIEPIEAPAEKEAETAAKSAPEETWEQAAAESAPAEKAAEAPKPEISADVEAADESEPKSPAEHIAELNRSAQSELSASAAAMSAASAVAVLEKEAAEHSVDAVIPETTETAPEASEDQSAQEEQPQPEKQRIRVFDDASETSAEKKAPSKKKPASEEAGTASKKKKKKKKKSRFNGSIFGGIIIVSIILTVSLLIAVTGIKLGMEFYGIGKSEGDIRFNIPEGSNNDRIADILVENGVIQNKTLFKIALKLQHDPTLYPGDITLQPSNGYQDIIEKLSVQRESYESVTVTFAEGENLLTIAGKLEEAKVCEADDFIFEFNRDQGFEFEKQIDKEADTFYAREGYFCPNTYEFYVNDSAENVSKKVKEQFQKQYTSTIEPKLANTKLNFKQIMTLASIVQLEAASVEEMPNVASVFINRLNDPDTFPMLQSDTTKNYIKNVINAEADTASARSHYTESYDTYACKGLPAGPICNPGIDAILAVINPARTNYYYFCNNLTTKQTFYAATLEEHEENLKKAGLA